MRLNLSSWVVFVVASLAVVFLPSAVRSASADEPDIELPQQHLSASEEIRAVAWIDLNAFTPDAISESIDRIVETADLEDATLLESQEAEWRSSLAEYREGWQKFTDAGVQQAVLVWTKPSAESDEAEQGEQDVDLSRGAMFLRTRADADEKRLEEIARELAKHNDKEVDAAQVRMVRLEPHWVQVVAPDELLGLRPEGEAAADLSAYREQLKKLEGAPVRFTWIPGPETDRQLRKAMVGGGAMFSAVLDPLRSLKAFNAGVYLEKDPYVRVLLQFDNEMQAGRFRKGLGGMTMLVSMLTSMGSSFEAQDAHRDDELAAAKEAATKELMAALLLKQNGSELQQRLGRHFFAAVVKIKAMQKAEKTQQKNEGETKENGNVPATDDQPHVQTPEPRSP